MFTAEQARANTAIHTAEHTAQILKAVEEAVETMGKSIEYRSRRGDYELEFFPFNIPQFPTVEDKKMASKLFEEIFEENGYMIIRNDPINNVFFVAW